MATAPATDRVMVMVMTPVPVLDTALATALATDMAMALDLALDLAMVMAPATAPATVPAPANERNTVISTTLQSLDEGKSRINQQSDVARLLRYRS